MPATLVSGDPVLAGEVQAILNNPVASQHPDLIHFRPQAGSAAAAVETGTSIGSGAAIQVGAMTKPASPLAAIAAAAAALLLAAALAALVQCARRRLAVRVALGLIGLSVVSAVAAAALVGVDTRSADRSVTPPSSVNVASAAADQTPGAVLSALRSHSVTLPVGTASKTWSSLVAIETMLAQQQERLSSDEQQISAITQQLAGAAPTATPAAEARHSTFPAVLESSLQETVADHATVLTLFNSTLQTEYSFFVSAAQSPDVVSELKSVAVHTPPDVQQAVTTNLDLVTTQLQQEAQIAAAAQLAAQSLPAGTVTADLNGPAPTFHVPVSGVVTQPFGATEFALEPPLTYNGVFYPHFHTGLDLAAPLDTPVHAAADGQVLLAASSVDAQGHLVGYGNYVLIQHADGYLTLYGHLDRILVSAGQSVHQGDTIGLLGSTGWSTGPHVHFEIRKGGVYVDPVPYVAAELRH